MRIHIKRVRNIIILCFFLSLINLYTGREVAFSLKRREIAIPAFFINERIDDKIRSFGTPQDPYSPLPLSSILSLNLRLTITFKGDVILRYHHPYPYPQILRVTLRFFKVAPGVLKK